MRAVCRALKLLEREGKAKLERQENRGSRVSLKDQQLLSPDDNRCQAAAEGL